MSRNKTNSNLALAGFEDIFNVGTPQSGEYVQMLPLSELHEPDPHPFAVRDDEEMAQLAENIPTAD